MTDSIDPVRNNKPLPATLQDEVAPRPKPEQKQTQSSDRISLGGAENIGKTYGPGLKVGSVHDMLRNLVIKTLEEQGVNLRISTGEGDIDLTTLNPEEAQELISEDGYFGVEKTSQRIVDFAVNAFGHDPAKLEEMRAAIDKGFLDAQQAFGGALPEISQQTYTAIMEKLDAFATQSEVQEDKG